MSEADEIRDALATPEQVQRAREYAASNSVTEIWQQRCRDGVYDDCPEVRSPLAVIIDGDAALAAEKARADEVVRSAPETRTLDGRVLVERATIRRKLGAIK